MNFKTEGERIFFEYLKGAQTDIEKGVIVAGKEIDYLLRTRVGDVYCQVADVGEIDHKGMLKSMYLELLAQSHLFRPKFAQRVEEELQKLHDIAPGPRTTSFDPAINLQKKLEEKARQIEPVLGKSPTVLVVYDAEFRPGDADLLVRLTENNHIFSATRMTGFSAIAILKEATESGKNVPRLRVYPNPYASCKLPDGVFSGKADVTVNYDALWQLPTGLMAQSSNTTSRPTEANWAMVP